MSIERGRRAHRIVTGNPGFYRVPEQNKEYKYFKMKMYKMIAIHVYSSYSAPGYWLQVLIMMRTVWTLERNVCVHVYGTWCLYAKLRIAAVLP